MRATGIVGSMIVIIAVYVILGPVLGAILFTLLYVMSQLLSISFAYSESSIGPAAAILYTAIISYLYGFFPAVLYAALTGLVALASFFFRGRVWAVDVGSAACLTFFLFSWDNELVHESFNREIVTLLIFVSQVGAMLLCGMLVRRLRKEPERLSA